ncbi:hypothetical protein C731_3544 [Mycolicibacterium hassiacum DSM 44199]|uniref:Uncharacterized protein n=1 Tax=Mycolicibacterium hassiacum (strain DSM 44199 / CIP 105218 / JCM 12690 / 3849) TaxID=1122247 RepID=K5BAL9_MYCHD|nr:hypothetical protein C731_3544 [Mycolicibacterium hassiacum DSM 44199]MDA4084871.1 hypothetical protein [Mycolicibacterium hassiacum DSM 44199]
MEDYLCAWTAVPDVSGAPATFTDRLSKLARHLRSIDDT